MLWKLSGRCLYLSTHVLHQERKIFIFLKLFLMGTDEFT